MKKSVKKVAKKVVKVAKVEPKVIAKVKEYKIPSTGVVAVDPIIKG